MNSFLCSSTSNLLFYSQFDEGSKHTDTRKFSRDTVAVLKEAAKQDSDLSKKIEELLKK